MASVCGGCTAGGLPTTVLLAYFLICWAESFPLTAFMSLLNDDLHLSLSTITTFYAVTYFPFMWKPLFGWISDSFSFNGYRRIPYVLMSSVGWAISLLVLACFVRTGPALFLVYFCCTVFNAFLQLMVGTFLVDLARRDTGLSAKLQGQANAAKWAGTLSAQLLALACYAHGSGSMGADDASVSTRQAIALAALAPTLIAVISPCLPEERELDSRVVGCLLSGRATKKSCIFGTTVAVAQANFILIGCQTLMDFQVWLWSVIALASGSACVLVALYCRRSTLAVCRNAGTTTGEAAKLRQNCHWIRLCLFVFIVNALPTSGVAVGQLQYAAFSTSSYQGLSIIASLTSLVASFAFSGCSHWRLRNVFIMSTTLAVLVGLTPLAFAIAATDGVKVVHTTLLSEVGALGIGASVLGGVASIFTILPIDTLVTYSSAGIGVDRSSTAYAILLSFYSFGATVGGLVSAPILEVMGLDGAHWSALPSWIVITALLKLLIFPLLIFVPFTPPPSVEGPTPSLLSHPEAGGSAEDAHISLEAQS